MTKREEDPVERTAQVAGTELRFVEGGRGPSLLVLHEELGYPGWMTWNGALAGRRKLFIPHHPGWGRTERLEWMRSVRDLAGFYARVLRERGEGPVDVIGFSLGGWIAAEMVACDPKLVRRLVLVAPMGLRPVEGEIMDVLSISVRSFLRRSVADAETTPEFLAIYGGEMTPERFELFEDARTETARLCWEPYMHNPSLGPLLEGVRGLPTLLVWGDRDRIVPFGAIEAYRKALPEAHLARIEGAGHRPEIERPNEFVAAVQSFLLDEQGKQGSRS